MKAEGFGGGGVVASAFGDVQVGLSAESIRSYTGVARRFLAEAGIGGEMGAQDLTAADVIGFARRECGRRGVGLGEGDGDRPAGAVALPLPGRAGHGAAGRRGAIGGVLAAGSWQRCPRGVSPADLARIVESCDRRVVAGRRDYAVILLLAAGLAAGEVAALDLGRH